MSGFNLSIMFNDASKFFSSVHKCAAQDIPVIVADFGNNLRNYTVNITSTGGIQGLGRGDMGALSPAVKDLVRCLPVVSIVAGVVTTIGLTACGAYQLYKSRSVSDDNDKGMKEQLKITQEDMNTEEYRERSKEVKQQINRHVALRDKYKKIYADTSIKRRVLYAAAAVAIPSLITAVAVNPFAAVVVGVSIAVVAGIPVLGGVVKKCTYGYLTYSHRHAANNIRMENSALMCAELSAESLTLMQQAEEAKKKVEKERDALQTRLNEALAEVTSTEERFERKLACERELQRQIAAEEEKTKKKGMKKQNDLEAFRVQHLQEKMNEIEDLQEKVNEIADLQEEIEELKALKGLEDIGNIKDIKKLSANQAEIIIEQSEVIVALRQHKRFLEAQLKTLDKDEADSGVESS